MKVLCRCSWLLLLLFVGFAAPSQAQSANCGSLFQAKKYIAAAECFKKKADNMPNALQLSKIQRYLKGQTMRNASLAYQKAATKEQNVEIAAYRREQAIQLLRQYLKENLCQKKYLCQQAKGSVLELLNKIKYTPLSIITQPGKRATVKVTGYKFNLTHISPPQWNKSVRPGRFQIKVRYESGKVVTKKVIVSPGQARTVTMLMAPKLVSPAPKPQSTSSSAVPWVLLGVGIAIAGGGGGLLGFGMSQTGKRDSLSSELSNEASNKSPAERLVMAADANIRERIKEMDGAHQTATTMLPLGWALAGVGVATALTGVVLFFVKKPKAEPTKAALPKASRTPILTVQP